MQGTIEDAEAKRLEGWPQHIKVGDRYWLKMCRKFFRRRFMVNGSVLEPEDFLAVIHYWAGPLPSKIKGYYIEYFPIPDMVYIHIGTKDGVYQLNESHQSSATILGRYGKE